MPDKKLKYAKPKILLVDLNDETETILREEGYNVSSGSFGIPYKMPKCDEFQPVIANGRLPNYSEQEVVIINLVPRDALDKPKGEEHMSRGEKNWWVSCNRGVIDPRPRIMESMRSNSDRILSNGGIFIIFADSRDIQKMALAHVEHHVFLKDADINYDNWCFLSILNEYYLHVFFDHGYEIIIDEKVKEESVGQILSEHIKGASFSCTLHPDQTLFRENSWITMAKNKYDAPVSVAIAPNKGKGLVFIFPRLKDKPLFLIKLLKNAIPELAPHLFPHMEGSRWVQRPEYELLKVLELNSRLKQIKEDAEKQIIDLKKEIEDERKDKGYLYDLIRETGTPLVDSVKKVLEILGFKSVVDVDEEMKKTADTGFKHEDLQINDYSPALLVEVKGIAGLPSDADALQVWKYVAPRMKEWNRTDIQGLSIINHQRNLPALDRDNKTPFREDILTNAQEQSFGLLTTWDLFRLTRSYIKNGWKHKYIKDLFYQSGRIEPVPKHYELIGSIERFWPEAGAVGVRIKESELKQGDRIAFELPVEFEEQDAESLMFDNKQVDKAEIDELVGIKTNLNKEQARKGVRVFRLRKPTTR
jgi:hypothetical protein